MVKEDNSGQVVPAFNTKLKGHFSHSELFAHIRYIIFSGSTDDGIDNINNNLVQRVMQ